MVLGLKAGKHQAQRTRRPAVLLSVKTQQALILLIAWAGFSTAWGNGDEFFRGDAFTDDKPLDTQVIFSGTVKDQDGNYVEDATLTVAITVDTPRGERRVAYNAYTNNIGRFRALDVATVILVMEEVEVDVDPAQVELTVSKAGYRVTRRLDRSRRGQKSGVFEVDFTLAPTGTAAD